MGLIFIWDNEANFPSFGGGEGGIVCFQSMKVARHYFEVCVPKRWRKKRMEIKRIDDANAKLIARQVFLSGGFLHLVYGFNANGFEAVDMMPIENLAAA